MVKSNARPEKQSYVLVKFFHGANGATQERYTDWQQAFLGHKATPKMELEIPDNEGTFDDRELRIVLPADAFSSRAANGLPHSPIYVQVDEFSEGLFTGDQNTQLVLFKGRVVRTIANFQGRPNTIAFFCLPIKSRLDIPMGLPCNHHCVWTLFGRGCGLNEAIFDIQTEIASVDGQEVTITDSTFTTPAASDPRYWRRGYLEKDGLRISIRDYDYNTDPTKVQMARRVPDDWVGGSNDIRAVPGCDKTVETCRARYNNEEHFGGIGYAIPAYQPNIESPS